VLSYKSPEAVQISDEKLEEFSMRALQAYNRYLRKPVPLLSLLGALNTYTEHK
jgi:hypothetical protein